MANSREQRIRMDDGREMLYALAVTTNVHQGGRTILSPELHANEPGLCRGEHAFLLTVVMMVSDQRLQKLLIALHVFLPLPRLHPAAHDISELLQHTSLLSLVVHHSQHQVQGKPLF